MLRKLFFCSILHLKTLSSRFSSDAAPRAYVFWQRKQKCLDFFKVQIEPKDLQKRQAPLWIREKKPRMMRTLLNLCKKLFKKFIWAKTGQRKQKVMNPEKVSGAWGQAGFLKQRRQLSQPAAVPVQC